MSKVHDWAELPQALDRARMSDDKVLVEVAVPGREIDIGVLERPSGDLDVGPPMEIRPSTEHTFFDYQAKYADSATVFDVPAELDPAISHAIGQDALRLFRELGCAGLVRVDLFLRPDGTRILNEVNTLPASRASPSIPECGRPPASTTATFSTSWSTPPSGNPPGSGGILFHGTGALIVTLAHVTTRRAFIPEEVSVSRRARFRVAGLRCR